MPVRIYPRRWTGHGLRRAAICPAAPPSCACARDTARHLGRCMRTPFAIMTAHAPHAVPTAVARICTQGREIGSARPVAASSIQRAGRMAAGDPHRVPPAVSAGAIASGAWALEDPDIHRLRQRAMIGCARRNSRADSADPAIRAKQASEWGTYRYGYMRVGARVQCTGRVGAGRALYRRACVQEDGGCSVGRRMNRFGSGRGTG
jgi:hypothetical protein